MPRPLLLSIVGLCFSSWMNAATIDARVSGFDDAELSVLSHVTQFWEDTIADPITVKVSFAMRDLAGDLLGSSFGFVQNARELPKEATVEIDSREGAVFGWFVDPTPESAEEFVAGSAPWHYRGKRANAATQQYDLLTVLHHELAHVLGFTTAYGRFGSRVELADDGFLRNYIGDSVTATLAPDYEGTHLSDAFHAYDLMTAFQGRGERMLPSDLDLALLADAYGYTLNIQGDQSVPEPVFTFAVAIALLFFSVIKRWNPVTFRAVKNRCVDPIHQNQIPSDKRRSRQKACNCDSISAP
jgi:hypothetical protein